MANGASPALKLSGTLAGAFALLALAWPWPDRGPTPAGEDDGAALAVASAQATASPPPPPPPPLDPYPRPVAEVLRSGILIVISKKSQSMHVFRDGALWKTSPVSTGRRGHGTPSGVFAILQKRVRHRSNKYSNAPMPYMQRLTWDGIAIHAGHLPGYPASHGCVRLPFGFARELYEATNFTSTTVVITNAATENEASAKSLALAAPMPPPPWPAVGASIAEIALSRTTILPRPAPVATPSSALAAAARTGAPRPAEEERSGEPTVQFAASESAALAEAEWARLVSAHSELAGLRKIVVSATVNGRPVWRLRASGPDAASVCSALQGKGVACFSVS